MKIHPIITDNALQNIFYILEYGDKKALVIDPSETQLCQDFLDTNNLSLESILISHEHYDHYEGVLGLACDEVWVGEICSKNMPIEVSHIFQDGDIVFQHENISLKAIATPGHAAGHMIFELTENGRVTTIFSADALFAGGVGHTRAGSSEELYHSIQKFSHYDDLVMIYSGHDYLQTNAGFIKNYLPEKTPSVNKILKQAESGVYFTNLGEERSYNPFLGVDKQTFIKIRELRNNY